jgi:hypothetical protein
VGIDFDANLAIGFLLTEDEVERPFMKHVPEVWHHEVRFNEKTGQPFQLKVVDTEEGDYTLFKGEDLTGDPIQIVEAICKELGELLKFDVSYDYACNMYSDCGMHFVIGPTVPFVDGELDPWTLGNPELRLKAAQVSDALKAYGFEPGEYRIRALESIT